MIFEKINLTNFQNSTGKIVNKILKTYPIYYILNIMEVL